MKYDITEIKATIPHRYPFLLVDRVDELRPGEKATGVKLVSAGDPFFEGHFPGYPVMPGVLIVEAMAQVGAVAILSHPDHRDKLAFLVGLDKVKLRRQVVPGDVLRLECRLDRMRRGVGKATATASVDGELAAEAEITFALGSGQESG